MSAPRDVNRIDWLGALPRAAFLACSWTWCIGMYLPVILVREFGWAGWVAFAVPNVVGAASIPFILRTREASERFVARHAGAMRWFSGVTIAFHAMFLTWMGAVCIAHAVSASLRSIHIAGATLALVVGVVGVWSARFSHRWWAGVSPLVWLASVLLVGLAILRGRMTSAHAALPVARPVDLAMLAPVMAFGFMLCPFLDLTFHRVRRESDTPTARAAFVLGFGALFLVMILGSLGYARHILTGGEAAALLLAHFALQSAFTIGVHAREVRERVGSGGARVWTVTPVLAGVALGLVPASPVGISLNLGAETVYLCFMGHYALAFPALVWAFARREEWTPGQRRRALIGWAIACLIGAPMLWRGFVDKDYIWLAPGLIMGLLARPIARVCARGAG